MNIPLFLTGSRIVFAVAVAVLLLAQDIVPFRVTIAAALFIVAAVTDYFDGLLARAWNQKTEIGAFLDPLADKLLVYLAFIYLTVVDAYPVWILLVLFTRDIVTDTFRAFATGKGHSMPANMVSKWKSLFQMASLSLLLVLGAATELRQATEWGRSALPWFVDAPAFVTAFTIGNYVMVAAAVTGVIGTIQYFVEHGPTLFRTKKSRR